MARCPRCGQGTPEDASSCPTCGAALGGASRTTTRRVVTVVFADVVGSTALGERLDPEALRGVMARYFDRARRAVERHGGTVEKFIGDAVMGVFGFPVLHEDDALRAVRATEEIRDGVRGLNEELRRTWGVELEGVRCGVNTGEVVAGDPAAGQALVTGDAVNVAARLQQAARPGEVLLGELTYRLVRDAVVAEDLAPVAARGKTSPVPARRLVGVTPGAEGVMRRLDSPMVGRERERDLLRWAFERAAADRTCQLVTVLGAAGIGKSRLAEEFLQEVEGRARVLRGRCLPYGEGITFWAVAEVVEEAVGAADPELDLAARIRAALTDEEDGPLIAERVAQIVGAAGGSAMPEETAWAIRRFVEALARERPLVLVLEDVHWGEPTFLDLLDHLAERITDAPVVLLCLARPELMERRPGWAGGKPNAATVLLEPLAATQCDALVRNLLGRTALDASVRARIMEAADGVPLFVEELLAMLIDDGLLLRDDGRWVPAGDLSDLTLPPTISGLLAARLERLDPDERAVVEAAAVVGKVFHRDAVAALLAPGPASHVDGILADLTRKEMVRPVRGQPGLFRFRHLLIRDTAYASLPKRARALLHERYAGWLEAWAGERLPEYEEIVGYHLEQAHRLRAELGPVDDAGRALAERAGRRLAAAGMRAVARGDVAATTSLLARAADLLPPADPGRLALLPDLADALLQMGQAGRADALLEEMLELSRRGGRRGLEARARLDRSSLRLLIDPRAARPGELLRVAREAVAAFEGAGDPGSLAAALEQLATLHRLVTGDIEAMLEASERALALAREAGAWNVLTGSALALSRALLLGPTPCDRALARLEELSASFPRARMVRAALALDTATVLGMLGDVDRAHREIRGAREVFEDLGQGRWVAEASIGEGVLAWWRGDRTAAERRIRQGLDLFRQRGEAADVALAQVDLGRLLCEMERLDEAVELADAVERGMPSFGLEPQVGWRMVRAGVLSRRGEHGEAERLLREAEDLVATTGHLTLRSEVLLALAGALRAAGRREESAAEAARALEAFTRKRNATGADRARALLGP
ncbi:MAG TPA: AAA family ATPase [Actinomycetota bacterium]|nr:AAA family ATPase [Actinomycetota bacterium]